MKDLIREILINFDKETDAFSGEVEREMLVDELYHNISKEYRVVRFTNEDKYERSNW